MDLINRIGYRLNLENHTYEQLGLILSKYTNMFGSYCEFKITKEMLENDTFLKLKWIRENFKTLEFSLHFPKDFLFEGYDFDYFKEKLCLIPNLILPINIIVHLQDREFDLDMGKYIKRVLEIVKYIPNNVTILLENEIVEYDCYEYLIFLEKLSICLKLNNVDNVKFCLDFGHLFFSMKESEEDILNLLKFNKHFLSYICEFHIHDYTEKSDHKILGDGKIDLFNLFKFIIDNKLYGDIIIENTINDPLNEGVRQIQMIYNTILLVKGEQELK